MSESLSMSQSEKDPPPGKTLYRRVQEKVWNIVQPDWVDGKPDYDSLAFDIAILGLIVTSAVAIVIGSVEQIHEAHPGVFWWIEAVVITVFTAEYLVRLWSCPADDRWDDNLSSRLRYVVSTEAMIDLSAILPFYIGAVLGVDAAAWLLAARMLRLVKLWHYFRALRTLGEALYEKRAYLFASGFIAMMIILTASVLLYAVEGNEQPEAFGSIPAAMWWSVITLTTVGYGDVSPITPFGKVLAGLVALCGIGLVALPAGIITNAFGRILDREEPDKICSSCDAAADRPDHYCRNCGTKFHVKRSAEAEDEAESSVDPANVDETSPKEQVASV